MWRRLTFSHIFDPFQSMHSAETDKAQREDSNNTSREWPTGTAVRGIAVLGGPIQFSGTLVQQMKEKWLSPLDSHGNIFRSDPIYDFVSVEQIK